MQDLREYLWNVCDNIIDRRSNHSKVMAIAMVPWIKHINLVWYDKIRQRQHYAEF